MRRALLPLLLCLLPAAAIAEPKEQVSFSVMIEHWRSQWTGSANALAKQDMPARRAADIARVVGAPPRFAAWELFVLSVNVDRSGHVWLALVSNLDPRPSYVVLNLPMAPDDRFGLALSPRLIEVARTLERGDRVLVDGDFMLDTEAALFEYGHRLGGNRDEGMTVPKFAARFTAIERVGVTPARLPIRPGR